MIWRNTAQKFGIIHQSLHWIIAILVIAMICVGLYMEEMENGPKLFKIYALHKSVGITVLALVVLRLIWVLSSKHPQSLPNHRAWEKFLAKAIHGLLYVALLAMPLSGWIMSSAKGFSVSVFGLFTLPDLVHPDKGLAQFAVGVHEYAAWILIAMIALHVAGALKHHIIDRDDTLKRMIPGATVKTIKEDM